MQNSKRERLVLTFALSPKGMANATEIDQNIKPTARQQLLEMREISVRAMRLAAFAKIDAQ